MSNGSSAGKFISLTQAVEMATRYRQNKGQVTKPEYASEDILAICSKFDRNIFDVLLSKTNCAAIRIYYGMDADLKIHPILVAVNNNNEDILSDPGLSSTLEPDDIGEDDLRCPPWCPPPSPLNS